MQKSVPLRSFILYFQDGSQKELKADRYSTVDGEIYFYMGARMTDHFKKIELTMIDEKES